MKFTELNMLLALITFILFIIYKVIKFFRNQMIRPTFSIIDDIYNDFYDVYFKDVISARQYLFLGDIYRTMSTKFTKSFISDDVVAKYINYLDENSMQSWFLSIISVLASLLGISNIESLIKFMNESGILNLKQDNKNIPLVIGLFCTMFIIVFFNKFMSRNNFFRNTRNSWKKSILQDYMDFPRSNVTLDLCKLQQSRKILDFLSCFTLKCNKKKIKFKKDKSIKILGNHGTLEYDKPFNFEEETLTIVYQETKYPIKIKLMDDNRNIEIIPVNGNNANKTMSDSDEFKKLCEVKNYRVKAMSQRSYTLPLLGWFYKTMESSERDGKKVQKFLISLLFFVTFLLIYIGVAWIFFYGGALVLLLFVVNIFADFLITKIFGN